MPKLSVIILAAGQGTRLKQSIPKPLIPVLSKPCLLWLWAMLERVGIDDVITVIHPDSKEFFHQYAEEYKGQWAYQAERLGTAHAAEMGLRQAKYDRAIIINGDTPCLPEELIHLLLTKSLALVGFNPLNLHGYGLVAQNNGFAQSIQEESSASTGLANAGVYVMPTAWALQQLATLKPQGAKNEYWITDLIRIAHEQDKPFEVIVYGEPWQYEGINTVAQWMALENSLQASISHKMIAQGVYLQDASSIVWSADMQVAPGVRIGKGCVFEGVVTIEEEVVIEPYCVIRSSHLSKGSLIRSHSNIKHAQLGQYTSVGPFSHLDQVTCGQKNDVGNYVEIKRSHLGNNNKIKHLAYLGDVFSGVGLNVGAGAIVCNYDGRNKHQTIIGNGVFIGSNVTLIAPIQVGDYAVIGAGSVVSKKVPESMLSLSRAELKTINYSLCRILKERWSSSKQGE